MDYQALIYNANRQAVILLTGGEYFVVVLETGTRAVVNAIALDVAQWQAIGATTVGI